jgi:hypothetical protein
MFHDCCSDRFPVEPENSWQTRHPSQWSNSDVLDLLYYVAEASNFIDATQLRGEKFQDVNGITLPTMSKRDFIIRDPNYGHLLYDTIQDLLDKC